MENITFEFMGKTEKSISAEIGAYSYECKAKDKNPQSIIYFFEDGSWIASHKLTKLVNGNYSLKH